MAEGVGSRKKKQPASAEGAGPPETEQEDPGRPSITKKESTLLTLANNMANMANSQKQLTVILLKKMGIPLPGDLAHDFEIQVNFIEEQALKEARTEKAPNPLSLDNVQVLMEPACHVLMWEAKGPGFTSLALEDSWGVDGAYIISFRNKILVKWPHLGPPDLKNLSADEKILASGYLSLRSSCETLQDNEDREQRVKEFFQTYRPVMCRLRECLLEHHVAHIKSACGPVAAAKFEVAMGVLAPENNPLNSSNAVKGAAIGFGAGRTGGMVKTIDDGRRNKRETDRQTDRPIETRTALWRASAVG